MWLETPLTLASGSATRRQLLEQAGLQVSVERPSPVIELGAKAEFRGAPDELAEYLARVKAASVAVKTPGLVLGADQTLLLDQRVFDKPSDLGSAANQLRELGGKTHRLMSSLSLWHRHEEIWTYTEVAQLAVRPLTAHDIDLYVERMGASVQRSVGGYQIEGPGIQLFEKIEGDYFTILGLPLIPLLTVLREFSNGG
jgi:septum formation protein